MSCDRCEAEGGDVSDAYAGAPYPVPALLLCAACRDHVMEDQAGCFAGCEAIRSRQSRAPVRVTLDPALRARLADAAERIIALLDACDGEPDAEPDVDGEEEPEEASLQPIPLRA